MTTLKEIIKVMPKSVLKKLSLAIISEYEDVKGHMDEEDMASTLKKQAEQSKNHIVECKCIYCS